MATASEKRHGRPKSAPPWRLKQGLIGSWGILGLRLEGIGLGLQRIELYILRMTASAFGMILVTLTGVIWVTQALREFDLLTSKGQTIVVFFVVTGLSLPLLFLVIAPIALFLAVIYTYNRLGSDSELIVMTSAGMSPGHILRPLVYLTLAVSVVVGATSVYGAPASMRLLRQEITKIRADVVANIVQPGKFTSVEKDLTFHIRARQPNGELNGLIVADRRDKNQEMIYLAEKGQIVEFRQRHFPGPEGRQPAAAHRARPGYLHRVLRALCLRPVAVFRGADSNSL